MKLRTLALLLGAGVLCLRATGQSYLINWYKVAGGGGASTNGPFTLRGTIGQHDAGGAMSGGAFALTGGFLSIYAVQRAGVPNLVIAPISPNSLKILWPDPATNSYTLEQTPNLSSPSWTMSGYTITSANGTNSITITSPGGNLFFRLIQ